MNVYRLSSNGALTANSSGGNLLKWKLGNTFIKTSTLDTISLTPKFMYESYAEVISSYIAKWLGYNTVEYSLCKVIIDNNIETIACESKDFTHGNYQYISIAKMMIGGILEYIPNGSLYSYEKLIMCIEKEVPTFKEYLDKNLILDYIVLNDDRHCGNFGLLRDNFGRYSTPPIFDTGNSLFYHKHTEGIPYSPDLTPILRAKPFSMDFETQISLVDLKYYNPNKHLKSNIDKLLNSLVSLGLPSDRAEFAHQLLKDRLTRLNILKQGGNRGGWNP